MAFNVPSSFPSSFNRSTLRSKPVIISFAVLLMLIFFVYTPIPSSCDAYSDAVVCQVADRAKKILPQKGQWQPMELKTVKSKYAFATFLAGKADSGEDDPYFIAARILAYQLLHANDTRSRDHSIPFVILATDKVSQAKQDRLRKDGAIVIVAESIETDWVKTTVSTWEDVMTKLRLWELEQFDRICMVDGDTVIAKPLDGVFQDAATIIRTPKVDEPGAVKLDEGAMPESYSFASVPEMNRKHGYPPTLENDDFPNFNYLNSGFFVFEPTLAMLNYYMSLLKIPGRFDPQFPEQNLLNYAHRRDGAMPWTQLNNTWNIHYPLASDIKGGVASLHDKWWSPEHDELKEYMTAWRWRMEGYFEALDAMRAA